MVPGSYCPWKEGLLVLFCVTLWEFEALFIVSDVVFDGVFSPWPIFPWYEAKLDVALMILNMYTKTT